MPPLKLDSSSVEKGIASKGTTRRRDVTPITPADPLGTLSTELVGETKKVP